MRQRILLILGLGLLCGIGMAPARAAPTLSITVGFDGAYRPGTLVPIAVTIDNTDGPTIRGELRILSQEFPEGSDRYIAPVTIARGATQLRFINFIPPGVMRQLQVELWSGNRRLASGAFTRFQEISGGNPLLAIVGGTGSTLNYANNQPLKMPQELFPRPWDLSRIANRQQQYGVYRVPGGPGANATANLRLAYVTPGKLPDNPEAYGSVGMLLLSSDVTENSLSAEAQQAIAVWAANGGHLLVAGGGVAARLDAPFFTGLLPARNGKPLPGAETINNPAVGTAWTRKFGSGRITLLGFDPDTIQLSDAGKAAKFFGGLIERNPEPPITAGAAAALRSSVDVNKLKPPNLTLIVFYLIIYLILLVPVNYFVLRKLDQRELAWLTTPAIVLLFTFGAYGIGYATKGNRLIFNISGVMETVAGQHEGEMVSSLLLFSPQRTSYRLDLGRDALLVRNFTGDESYDSPSPYGRPYRDESYATQQSLTILQSDDRLAVDRVSVSQWDYRRFIAAYRVDLGNGINAGITPGAPGAFPRATGKVTNNTPYSFQCCRVYQDGSMVAEFSMNRGQTVDLATAAKTRIFTPRFSEDEMNIFDTLRDSLVQQMSGGRLSTGCVFVGFTTDSLSPARLSRRSVRTELNAVVVHL